MSFFGQLGQSMTAFSVLDATTKLRMNPLQLRKAGAIIEKMRSAGYDDEQINHIARALFCDQSEEDMLLAWQVFEPRRHILRGEEDQGELDGKAFRKILPLMGEDVPEEQIEQLFREADTDGSGFIEFDEFVRLVRGMNPKHESSAVDESEDEDSGEEGPNVISKLFATIVTQSDELINKKKPEGFFETPISEMATEARPLDATEQMMARCDARNATVKLRQLAMANERRFDARMAEHNEHAKVLRAGRGTVRQIFAAMQGDYVRLAVWEMRQNWQTFCAAALARKERQRAAQLAAAQAKAPHKQSCM